MLGKSSDFSIILSIKQKASIPFFHLEQLLYVQLFSLAQSWLNEISHDYSLTFELTLWNLLDGLKENIVLLQGFN